jgi:hypothetical protein|tara:strand:+ start:96 stop:1571 length:1476 start_codon:yes stop_codon:yes gene_type:complete
MPANWSEYVDMIPEDVTPGDIYIGSVELARLTLPEFKVRQGTPEDALLQAAAHMSHLTISHINRLPPRIMEGVGRLLGIEKGEGTRATIEVTFTLNQDVGIDIPTGSQFFYQRIAGGETSQYSYETTTGIAVADWSGTPAEVTVILTSTEVSLHPVVTTGTEFFSQNVIFQIDTIYAQQSGTAQAGTSTSITLAATASATDDYYNNKKLTIISGTGNSATQVTITDYVGSTKVATVASWPSGTPDATSVYKVNASFVNGSAPERPFAYLTRVRSHLQSLASAMTKAAHAQQSIISNKTFVNFVKAYDLTNSGGAYPRLAAAANDLGYITLFTYGNNRQLTTAEKQEISTYVADRSVAGLTIGTLDVDIFDLEVAAVLKYNSVYNSAALETSIKNKVLTYLSPLGYDGVRSGVVDGEGITSGAILANIQEVAGVLYVESVTLSVASGNSSSGTAHSALYQVTGGNIEYLAKGMLPQLSEGNLTITMTAVTVA